ncbi:MULTISPECIES: hypothetical protein [Enterobacteriaceae]|jgi:hypothetical protein|uniref:hypothetical protein n=1 Tax=Enterobacteriaceae TaxID=543 RepID=UPI0005055D80|nr:MULTISPECIES: hypothetical protein [Enterobacteriaceae]EAM8585782.1 hypothetical protein [Salmonella enterica]EAW2243757.1 hypothetical protein [Salmonella enterica subsp. enterica]EAZ0459625.1 hypothetical protein [Salmonella enterica]EBP3303301.1 hypothetical protein [Salmonella enterica subsp. enterica]EBQ3665487.1 hypothetical protein [Salmonella enterica]
MTKKKEPHELKPRGRKEKVHQNNDLRSHLAGVKNLNQLTSAAQNVIKKHIRTLTESKGSKKGMVTKNILILLTMMGDISKDKTKSMLDSSELFEGNNYSKSRVNDYKKVLTGVSKELWGMFKDGTPIRTDDPKGGEYLTGEELYKLTHLLESNPTKKELSDLIKKIYPS